MIPGALFFDAVCSSCVAAAASHRGFDVSTIHSNEVRSDNTPSRDSDHLRSIDPPH